MLPSFLPLLLALCATKFVNSAIIQEDRTIAMPENYHWDSNIVLISHDYERGIVGKAFRRLCNVAMTQIYLATCLEFRNIKAAEKGVKNHIHFVWKPDNNCNSMEIKEQSCNCPRNLTIGKNCATTQKVLINLLRGLGLHYQHKRSDRDQYVVLGPETGSWFNILPNALYYDLPFDPLSIMHPVTVTREDIRFIDEASNFIAGKAKSLSFYDKKTLNLMYDCDQLCPEDLPPCRNQGYRVESLECKCQCPKGFWGEKCEENENSHHLYNLFTTDEAFHIAHSIKDAIKTKFNPKVAFEAVNVIKDTMIGAMPTALLSEEVSSRDVFAITLGHLSYAKWGKEAVTKLGGNVKHQLRDFLKGNLIDIIKAARSNGGDDIVGRALGGTLGVHFTRSLGRGLVCGIKKIGHDTVSGLKWAGGKIEKVGHDTVSGLEWAGGKIKGGFTSVVDFFKGPPGKHYDSYSRYVGVP